MYTCINCAENIKIYFIVIADEDIPNTYTICSEYYIQFIFSILITYDI